MTAAVVDPERAEIRDGGDLYAYTGPGGTWAGVWDWARGDGGAVLQVPTLDVAWRAGGPAVLKAIAQLDLAERAGIVDGLLQRRPPRVETMVRHGRWWFLAGDLHLSCDGAGWTCSEDSGDGSGCTRGHAVDRLARWTWACTETREQALARAEGVVARVERWAGGGS